MTLRKLGALLTFLLVLTAIFTAPALADEVSIQIGAFQSARKAGWVAGLLEGIGPTRVERIPGEKDTKIYRVLIGKFPSLAEARKFVEEKKLRGLFPSLWLNIVVTEPPREGQKAPEPVSREELEKDPYFVQLNLHCDPDHRAGQELAQLQPESESAKVELKVNWSCLPDTWTEAKKHDVEHHPSHWELTPLLAIGGLSATNNSLAQAFTRSSLGFGGELSYEKNWGGIGAFAQLSLLSLTYSGDTPAGAKDTLLDSDASIGVRIPFSSRFQLFPSFGGLTTHYLIADNATSAHFEERFQWKIGARAAFTLGSIGEHGSFGLDAGVYGLLPVSTDTFSASTGLVWSAGLSAENFFNPKWGTQWFFRFESASLPSNVGPQSETRALLGISVLFAP